MVDNDQASLKRKRSNAKTRKAKISNITHFFEAARQKDPTAARPASEENTSEDNARTGTAMPTVCTNFTKHSYD